MTDVEAKRLRKNFFAELDVAMTELPYRVATDIRQGIAEEIDGLDARDTAERLASLGSPEAIAREAAESLGAPSAAPPAHFASTLPGGVDQARGFAIAAALVLAFGGFVVPILGFCVGAVMVGLSRLWHRWEKFVAILLPITVSAVFGGAVWLVGVIQMAAPVSSDAANPLLPAPYDIFFSAVLLALLLVPVCGLWLLWRLRGRTTAL